MTIFPEQFPHLDFALTPFAADKLAAGLAVGAAKLQSGAPKPSAN
jgi:hypothetical protein